MVTDSDWETRAFERHCTHCSRETQGETYAGRDYLRRLESLRGDEAMRLARKVEPFFWSDADLMHVRLCDACATALGFIQAAGAVVPFPAQRQRRAKHATGQKASNHATGKKASNFS